MRDMRDMGDVPTTEMQSNDSLSVRTSVLLVAGLWALYVGDSLSSISSTVRPTAYRVASLVSSIRTSQLG